jgi:hypothetical protein
MSKELDFQCPSCERKFASKTGLLSHQRTFHGLKPLHAKKNKANWRVEAGRKGGLAKGRNVKSAFTELSQYHKPAGFQCDLCDHKPFAFSKALGSHKYRKHGVSGSSATAISKRNKFLNGRSPVTRVSFGGAVSLDEAIAALEVKLSVQRQVLDELKAMQNA